MLYCQEQTTARKKDHRPTRVKPTSGSHAIEQKGSRPWNGRLPPEVTLS